MAIAWMYREDYARAKYLVLPAKRQTGFLAWLTAAPSILLVMASIATVTRNIAGTFECSATAMLGLGLLFYAARLVVLRSRIAARQLLKATIIYLPLEFLILVLGKA